MGYSSVTDVLEASGLMSLARIVSLYDDASVTTTTVSEMITKMIQEADKQIQDVLEFPILIKDEVHIADGENSEFDLGPSDEEHYSNFDVENCLENVVHCYHGEPCENYRYLHPYPVDCDDLITDDDVLWTETSNCTTSDETTIKRVGSESIKLKFTASGYARAVLSKEIAIDQYGYVAFLFRTDDKTVTFTLYLYDEDGNSNSQTFTVNKNDQWYIIWIRLDNMTGDVNWENEKLYKIGIGADGICDSAYIDMFNFNDGYCWEAPLGKLYIHEAENAGEEPPVEGYRYYVTYRFDPYLVSTPYNVRKASKYLAASDLIEHLIGLRQSATAFEAQGDSGERIPDREALFTTHAYLKKIAEEALASIGYGFDFSCVRG